MNIKRKVIDLTVITLGTAVVAAAIFFFMIPSKVVVGSGSALAMVLANFIPLPISVLSFAINAILLVVGFIFIGPAFGAKTVYTATMIPVFLGVLELLFPNFKSLTDDPIIDILCYIIIVSIGMAWLFSRNASSGGLDIVAKIMNKYLRMEIGRAISVSGIAVSLTSALCYDTNTLVLSVLATYFSGVVVDHFIFGIDVKRRVCIISPKLDEIADYILHELHSGATINEIIGAYDNTVKREIITIVDKSEYRRLMDYLRKTDPKAFVTVYSVSDMRYQPKVHEHVDR